MPNREVNAQIKLLGIRLNAAVKMIHINTLSTGVMECSDRATPVFFLKQGEACACPCVLGHLYVMCLCQSQHGEAPYRKQTSVERKTELMESSPTEQASTS